MATARLTSDVSSAFASTGIPH
ncbi:uncharacterized protein G2W53_004682 [Senna tora]|uniref:Uncharacterized protein n=1 Tax=Senna tora TaxID=362788 RepID=A0A835CHG1_9FABA|nr:uncharacterized protein G2W53_004682 [Senna tora]